MQSVDTFFGGSGRPVGSQVLMTDVGSTYTMPDGSIWLRSGTLATTATYPALSAIQEYQVLGRLSTTPPPAADAQIQIASNGTGTLVRGSHTAGQVSVSTNYGLTWTTITSGITTGCSIEGVVWTGSRFVGFGQNAGNTNGSLHYSTNGLAWTAGPQGGFTGSPTVKSGTVWGCWTGTGCVFVYGSSSNLTQSFTTTDGSGIGSTVGFGSTYIDGATVTPRVISDGAGNVVAFGNTSLSSGVMFSTNNGVSWSASTTQFSVVGGAAFRGTTLILTDASGSGTPGGTIVSFSSVSALATKGVPVNVALAGSNIVSNGTDAYIVNSRSLYKLSSDLKSSSYKGAMFGGTFNVQLFNGGGFVFDGGTSGMAFTIDTTTSDFSGLPSVSAIASASVNNQTTTSLVNYVRAK